MAEVFAGFVSGFFVALVSAPLLAIALLRLRGTSPMLGQVLPEGVNPIAVTMVLHGAMMFFWTGLGIVLGLLLLALDNFDDGIASFRNPPYALLVFSFILVIAAPAAFVLVAWWRQILAAAVVTFLIFGWLMPYLADWSKFDGVTVDETREYIAPTTALISAHEPMTVTLWH